jgi:outer membrane protein, multidrug efflux system
MSTFVAALAALTLAAAPPPEAQPPAGAPLTLDEALQRAALANTDLRAAQARLAQAKAGILKAWSFHLPQVTAGATWTHNSDAAVIPFASGYRLEANGAPLVVDPITGRPTGAPPYDVVVDTVTDVAIQKRDQIGGQVQVNQALIAPQAWFGIQAAYRGADVAAKSVEAARREVLFGVAQLYYGVTSLKKLVKVSEELQGIAARQEKDAKVRLEAGTIAKVGYLRAQIDLARADQDLIRARNAFESARLSLAAALDRDPDFEVVEPPEPTLPADTGGLEKTALEARPDLQAARLNEDLATSLRRVTAARYLPSLGAFARWQIANVGGFTGQNDSWAVGLGLTWTILDGGLREAELREGSARIAEAEANRRGLETRVTAEVRQALLDLDSARANAVKAREQARLAEENQRLVDVSFRAGAATAVEQADATAALRTAAIAATTEGLQAQLAAVKLLKVAGAFEPVARR